jgi:hypothetical protein
VIRSGWQTGHVLRHGPDATRMLIATWHASGLKWEGFPGRLCLLMSTAFVFVVIDGDRLRAGNGLVECAIRSLRERPHPAHEGERYERGHGS